MTIVRCSGKYLYFKTSVADIFRNYIFCSAIQYIVPKKQSVGSAHEVLAESLETVFDEAHSIVNLRNFLQSLALPRYTFLPSEPFFFK